MLINLSEVFTKDGKVKVYPVSCEMEYFKAPDGSYRLLTKEPFDVTVTNFGDRKLLIECETELTLEIPCSRCLDPVPTPISLIIERSADMKQSDDDRVKELDEQPYIEGYNLDVDQLVCNELLLSLPMKVLCSESCKGICNRCGANLNIETCDCETRSLDPRMSVIQDIFKEFKEV